MGESYLRFENLSVGYNRVPVVSDISFDVKKGEIIAMIGPNGAGKSTILKTVSRNLDIIGGKLFLEGKEIRQYSYKELSKKMAVILTDRIKAEMMTCRDIVATGRYPYTGRLGILSKEDEEKVAVALESVQAMDISEKDFSRISDGQRQRILLARAICQEPEIILLDEPTSYLDIRHKLELLSMLTEMARKKNITVITSLHEIDLAEKVADRIFTVKGKDVFEYGTPEEIFEENKIRNLYDIDNGAFDPLFGSIELKKPDGDHPEIFVIGGNGSGISVYRELQKMNLPFAAGIIHENDMDLRVARLLAAEVITEKAFHEVSEEAMKKAEALMDSCRFVLNAGCDIGPGNLRVSQLIKKAEADGKLVKVDDIKEYYNK